MFMKKITEFQTANYIPQLSVDIVILGYEDEVIKCLLLRVKDKWMLPGGYIEQKQSVQAAAANVLELRTGLKNQHLRFLSVFGAENRHFENENQFFLENAQLNKIKIDDISWFEKRFVTLSHYALVDIQKTHPQVSFFDEEWQWFDLDNLPRMWMDHHDIVQTARERLKEDIQHEPVAYNLLPEPFTMPALHQLHQVILGTSVDRSRFQKSMLALDKFERLPKLKKDSPGRSPFLYRARKAV